MRLAEKPRPVANKWPGNKSESLETATTESVGKLSEKPSVVELTIEKLVRLLVANRTFIELATKKQATETLPTRDAKLICLLSNFAEHHIACAYLSPISLRQ
jgi:hypothetical protein